MGQPVPVGLHSERRARMAARLKLKTREAKRQLTRSIEFTPAYDKRFKNYGAHGLEMRFVLKGKHGAVHFALSTNWQLPHVTKEWMSRSDQAIGGDPHWRVRPMPLDLGYHALRPHYKGQTQMPGLCRVLDDRPCYYDGSTLNAEPVFERLLAEGDAGVWDALEIYYQQTFEDGLACASFQDTRAPFCGTLFGTLFDFVWKLMYSST